MPRLILLACLALAGCGADGLPLPPGAAPGPDVAPAGLSLSGNMQLGVVSK